jgi:aromatic ring-cleaving dioxygenase
MTTKRLPDFESPSRDELRSHWATYADDPFAQRCLLEIVRLRRQMGELERLRLAALAAWTAEVGGHQVALYKMRLLLQQEIERT